MKTIISIILVLTITSVLGQNLRVLEVSNSELGPNLQWFTTGDELQARPFTVWRTTVDGDAFDTIQTLTYIDNRKQDTLIYTVKDTTLTEKGIYRYYVKLLLEDGKEEFSPIVYGHNMGFIQNPRVISMDVVSSKTQKAIDISWQLTNNFSVRSLSLFRSSHAEKDFVKIAELAGDATSYSDMVPLSNHNYFYFLLIADFFGYQQPSVPVPGFCLFEQQPYPPQYLSVQNQNDKINLSWQNVERNLSGYQVFRSIADEPFVPLHVMQTSNELEVSFVDSLSAAFSESSMLRYYIINFSDSYTKSNPSDTVSVYFKKQELPLPPDQFDAIVLDNGSVKLIWERNKSRGVIGYNVYLTEPEQKLLNNDLISANTNYLIDSTMHTSGVYSYAIEAVGEGQQVSDLKAMATVKILTPYYHLVVDMIQSGETADLSWKAFSTDAIKNISLYRQEDEQTPVLLKQFENVDATYKDNKLTSGKSYYYMFYGELKNGEKVLLNDHLSINF